ncbi:hypothetical protein HUU42_05165 [bacterium]|nr:hypothetical protein [bacterium]
MPLVTALIAATLPDYGLVALSFEIKDQEMNGDTLITFWSSSKFFSNLGQFKIAHVGERLVYSQYEDDNLHVKTKTTFDRYEKTAGIYFPTYMATELWLAEKFSFEKLSIRSMSVNQQLPSEVLFFQVPPNAIIEKKDW